jgi:hypothetical protein
MKSFLLENIGPVGVKDRRTRIKINSIDSKYSLYRLNFDGKLLLIWMIEHNWNWVVLI